MKRLFVILLFGLVPAAADEATPVESIRLGSVQVSGEPLSEGRARLNACWQAAQKEGDENYWRASLEEDKLNLQAGAHRELGPAELDVGVEQSWEEELENRKARLRLALPFQGWVLGGAAEMDWQRPEAMDWEAQPGLYQTWLESPRWWGVRARASWQRQAQEETRQLRFDHGRGQVVAEVAHHEWTAERRWLARFQYDLRHDARLATEVSRRWQDGWSEPESRVEARLELHF